MINMTERENSIYKFISQYVDEIVENHYALYRGSVETETSGDPKVDRNAAWARGALTMAAEVQDMLSQ